MPEEEKTESTESNVDTETSQETDTETTETSAETEGEEKKTEGEGGDQGEEGQSEEKAETEIDLDNLDEESFSFTFPTKDGERKVTLKDWKTIQGEATRTAQRAREEAQKAERERGKHLKEIELFKTQFPAEYAILEGLLRRDPDVVKDLPPEVQAQILLAQEKEKEKADSERKEQEDGIKERMGAIEKQLDEMGSDKEKYPDFDEQQVVDYARDHMIPDIGDAYRAWHYDKIKGVSDDQIAEIEKAAVLKFQQDVLEGKVPATPPPGGKGKVKEDEFKDLSPKERLRKRAEQMKVSEGMRK